MDDLISRQAVMSIPLMPKENRTYQTLNLDDAYDEGWGDYQACVSQLQSAQSERPFEIQDILDYLDTVLHPIISPEHWNVYSELHDMIAMLPSAQPEQQWIPFKTRPLTEEEKEDHPEWDYVLDCKLPDDGQRILVSINLRGHEEVQQDEFYTDDGSYLDSGYEIGTEATAWMPLPESYSGE